MSAAARLADALLARFGDRAVITEPAAIAPWLTDWRGRWTGAAAAILQPSSVEEAAAMIAAARDVGVPLVPQGGNTSMVGGATPPQDASALVLSSRRLTRLDIDAPARRAVAGAGVILHHLHEAAHVDGLRFPLSLGAKGSATIGGLTSTNAGGTQVLRFGPMRGLVDGVQAVLPDGTVHDGLTGLKKDNRGYSIDQLLIGAEGTLGFLTAVRLKLAPAIRDRAVAWLGLASPHDALAVLRALEAGTGQVEGFEILPDESLQAALEHIPGTRAPLAGSHHWHALVEAVAADDGDEEPAALIERLLAPLAMVEDAVISASEAQAEAFWHIRESLSEAEKKAFGPATQHDISVPVNAMPTFLDEAARAVEAAFPGTKASGFGHLGDGNIHFHVRAMGRGGADWVEGEGQAVVRLVDDLVTAAGGSISAEHGIGQMKRDELARLDPVRVAHIQAIKAALDPSALFNPGKLV